jgi:hypothetical protein
MATLTFGEKAPSRGLRLSASACSLCSVPVALADGREFETGDQFHILRIIKIEESALAGHCVVPSGGFVQEAFDIAGSQSASGSNRQPLSAWLPRLSSVGVLHT